MKTTKAQVWYRDRIPYSILWVFDLPNSSFNDLRIRCFLSLDWLVWEELPASQILAQSWVDCAHHNLEKCICSEKRRLGNWIVYAWGMMLSTQMKYSSCFLGWIFTPIIILTPFAQLQKRVSSFDVKTGFGSRFEQFNYHFSLSDGFARCSIFKTLMQQLSKKSILRIHDQGRTFPTMEDKVHLPSPKPVRCQVHSSTTLIIVLDSA